MGKSKSETKIEGDREEAGQDSSFSLFFFFFL